MALHAENGHFFVKKEWKPDSVYKYDFYLDTLYINRVWLGGRRGMGCMVYAVG